MLDPAARSVAQAGVPVTLSAREFDLLHALMLNAGRVLSREQLEQHLYSWGQEVESNAVEVHIHHLRRKLGSDADPDRARRGLHAAARAQPEAAHEAAALRCRAGCWCWCSAGGGRLAGHRGDDLVRRAHELDELLDSHLAQAAALLVVQQAREIEDDDDGVDAPSLHRYAPKVAFQVFHEGRLALRSANAPAAPMVAAGERFKAGFQDGARSTALRWRVFATHGAERDVQVYVGEQVDSRASILWAVLRSTLWPMLVALPLLALAAWWAVRRGVAPLRRLGRTLAERQPQALHPVVVAGAPSEMTPMLDALNGLFERIAGLMESERRFTADAAHELRTPIAAIRDPGAGGAGRGRRRAAPPRARGHAGRAATAPRGWSSSC